MNNSIIHNVLSYILILVFLFPIGIGFSHTLENHEHTICIAKKEKHIHSQKINCSYLNYFPDVQYQNRDFKLSSFLPGFINTKQVFLSKSFYFLSNFSDYLVRGPPAISAF